MIDKINFARNTFLRSTVSAFVLGGAMLTGMSALAATVEVPDGVNLNTLTPLSGDIWNLQGNDFLSDGAGASYSKALPAALTINGVSGGSSITMSDTLGHYGYFSGGNLTLSLSDVAISGGKQEMGGSINAASLILNTTGTVAFNNNSVNAVAANTLGYGGAIYTSVGGVKVNGNFSASDNSSGSSNKKQYSGMGGAVYSSGEFTVSGSLTLNNNTTTEGERALSYINTYAGLGGGIYTTGAVSVAGTVIADGNRAIGEQAGGAGGVIYSKDGSVSLAQASGDVILTNNYASQRGGAISSQLAGATSGAMNIGNANGRVLIGVDASGNAAGNKTSTEY